jgi:hypothetical protein
LLFLRFTIHRKLSILLNFDENFNSMYRKQLPKPDGSGLSSVI